MGSGGTAYVGENVPATSAGLYDPKGIAVDLNNGDIYIGAQNAFRIYVLTKTTGLVTTFAGNGVNGATGDGDAATSATLSCTQVHRYLDSVLYFADFSHNKIRSVYSVMPTVAPSATPSTVLPSALPTNSPSVLRSSINTVLVVAGTGSPSSSGSGGPASSASINRPVSIWMDGSFVYFSESDGNCVRRYALSDTIVYNVAGVCGAGGTFGGDSGPATSGYLYSPHSIVTSYASDLYIMDFYNSRVRLVSNGIISTALGTGSSSNSGDGGPASSASIKQPYGLWINSVGTFYLSTYSACVCRTVTSSGIVTLFAGTGVCSFSGNGGAATSATVNNPTFLVGDTAGLVYFSDEGNSDVFICSALMLFV